METTVNGKNFSFSGFFGVITLDANGKLLDLYLGEGHHIAYDDVKISALEESSSAWIQLSDNKGYSVANNGPVTLNLNGKEINVPK